MGRSVATVPWSPRGTKGATRMQRSRIPILGSVAALLLLQASARADLVSWSYNWTPNANTINADNAGTSKIFITNEPSGTARGATDLAATNIKVSSTAS